jgi:hypothetical protein
MKIRWLAVIIALMGLLMIALTGPSPAQGVFPHPRFEMLLQEYHPGFDTRIDYFEVWHDKETGQEFVCTMVHSSVSCLLTGRSWK